jgi:DNA-binding transcriptional LysR family regulator
MVQCFVVVGRGLDRCDMELEDATLFLRIRELGSLSAVARERNCPVSQISRTLSRLEAQLGVRLVRRSTHGLSLTDEGDTFARHAQQLRDTQAALLADLGRGMGGVQGWVRVACSPAVAQGLLAPSLVALYAQHPGLHIDIVADDRLVDLARDGIDIALRTGHLLAEHMVVRPLGTFERGLYASPDYLARHGHPRDAIDLQSPAHRLLGNSANPWLNQWLLADTPKACGVSEMKVNAHTRTDNTGVVLALARSGVGIARMHRKVAAPWLARAELVEVLPGLLRHQSIAMQAVMLPGRQRSPRVRACTDFWARWFTDTEGA